MSNNISVILSVFNGEKHIANAIESVLNQSFEDFEFLKSFIQTTKDAGSQKFIIHARKALLRKLTPKENLNIPPLKYDFVYKLKDFFKNDEIIINGGIKTSLTILITC